MISKETLVENLETCDVNFFEVTSLNDSFEDSILILGDNVIQDFYNFIKTNSIRTVYYTISSYNPNVFKISKDYLDRLSQSKIELIHHEVVEYNKQIEEIDFSRPINFLAFCNYEGLLFGIKDSDYWHEDTSLKFGEEKLLDLLNLYEDEFVKIDETENEKNEELIENVRNFLLKDDDFLMCTNQRLRRNYLYRMVEKEEIKPYRQLFLNDNGMIKLGFGLDFIERTWKIHKQKSG